MLNEENINLDLSEKILLVTCAALVTTYIGFALNARRQLKKSLKASDEMYQDTSGKIDEIVDLAKRKLTDN